MGFVASPQEIARFREREAFNFYDTEVLAVVWETAPATVKRLLPPPLTPAKRPLVVAFVGNYPRTDFGITYREAFLTLRAEFGGVEGFYVLAMNVTDDMALIGGREIWGYPKKLADIALQREGQAARGWAERHAIRYFSARARLTGRLNAPDALESFMEVFGAPGTSQASIHYNVKAFPSPDWQGSDYPPRLIRSEIAFRDRAVELGEVTVELTPSAFDPWNEVEVVRVLGAVYSHGDFSMRRGQVVAEADPEAFMPYMSSKHDPYA